jgi:hypothetical protein
MTRPTAWRGGREGAMGLRGEAGWGGMGSHTTRLAGDA